MKIDFKKRKNVLREVEFRVITDGLHVRWMKVTQFSLQLDPGQSYVIFTPQVLYIYT